MHSKAPRIALAATIATAAIALAAGPAQAAKSTMTLTIGNDSSAALAYSWGVSNSGSTHTGGGGGEGKANFQDLAVTREADAMSPTLVGYAAKGEHLQQVGFSWVNGIFTTSLCMKDALITSYSTGASTGEDRLTENITINFARFTYKVGTSSFAWSIVDNAPDANPC